MVPEAGGQRLAATPATWRAVLPRPSWPTPQTAWPAMRARIMSRPERAHHIGRRRRQLHPGVFEGLVDPVHLAGLLVDQRLAVAGRARSFADRRRRHETGPQQPPRQQQRQPGGVDRVGLAPRDMLDVSGVDQQHLEVVLQRDVRRLPYTPVDSIATCVTPSPASQSRNANRSGTVVPKLSISRHRVPERSGTLAQTTTSAWPTSLPAQRSIARRAPRRAASSSQPSITSRSVPPAGRPNGQRI